MSAPKFLSSKNDVDQILNDDKYDAFRRYTNTATWHGIPDLFNATGKIVKIFWIIVLLSSFSMLIYQMYNVIEDFAKEPHFGTSLVATVSPNGVPMPNVTICNLVRASKRKIDDIGMNLEALSYLYGSLPQCYKTSSVTLGKNSTRLKIEFQKFAVKFGETNVDPVKVFDVIGPDCNDTIIKCWWTGMEFPCCNYAKAILTSFGKCYSITPPAGMFKQNHNRFICYSVLC